MALRRKLIPIWLEFYDRRRTPLALRRKLIPIRFLSGNGTRARAPPRDDTADWFLSRAIDAINIIPVYLLGTVIYDYMKSKVGTVMSSTREENENLQHWIREEN